MNKLNQPFMLSDFKSNWKKFLIWGIFLVIGGIFAITFSGFTTLMTIILLGAVLVFGGAVIIIDTLQFWRRKKGFALHLTMGALYLITGLLLLTSPILGSISLTLLLALLFILLGSLRIYYALGLRSPGWNWNLLSGIITLLLGILILAEWPASGLVIIGLFVGIDLLILGWSYIMLALYAKDI